MNQKILLIKMITKTAFCNKIYQLIIIQLDINALNSHEILYEVLWIPVTLSKEITNN